jgi:hypothetical protein
MPRTPDINDKYVKTNVEGLVKDKKSGAILNVDHKSLQAYRRQKRFMDDSHKNSFRLDKVEKDISEIKEMFQQLLEIVKK